MGALHTWQGTVAYIALLDRKHPPNGDRTMTAKFFPAIVAGLLLGTTALASAQTLVYPQYGYNYGYYRYTPVYPPAVTFGFGVADSPDAC